MSLRIPRHLRTVCAALALAAYVLPLGIGLAARIGHEAEHALALLADLERRAVAMGVAHLHDVKDERSGAAFVHSHGGTPHAHHGGVGALLVAADETHEHTEEPGVTAPVELSSHLPTARGPVELTTAHGRPAGAATSAALAHELLPPPLPPPRA
jgi:hypothetical protein